MAFPREDRRERVPELAEAEVDRPSPSNPARRNGDTGAVRNAASLLARSRRPWPMMLLPDTTISSGLVGIGDGSGDACFCSSRPSPKLSIVWDEGYTLGREARVRTWFRALQRPGRVREDVERRSLARWSTTGCAPPRPDELDTTGEAVPAARDQVVLAVRPRGAARTPAVLRDRRHDRRCARARAGTTCRDAVGPMLVFSLTAGALGAFFRSGDGDRGRRGGCGAS